MSTHVNSVSVQVGHHQDQWLTLSSTLLAEMDELVINQQFSLMWAPLGDKQVLVVKGRNPKRGTRKVLRWVMDNDLRHVCRRKQAGVTEVFWQRGTEGEQL